MLGDFYVKYSVNWLRKQPMAHCDWSDGSYQDAGESPLKSNGEFSFQEFREGGGK
jgi:hypothetical protein